MKSISMSCLVLFLFLSAIPAGAETIGLYFDSEAERNCIDGIGRLAFLDLYVVYSNPTIENLFGFELGITTQGDEFLNLSNEPVCGTTLENLELDQITVACGAAIPCVEHTLLVKLAIAIIRDSTLPPVEILLFLHGARNPSQPGDLPLVLLEDGSFLPVDVDGDRNGAVALITGIGEACNPGLPTAEQPWDAIKSLYR